MKIYKISIIYFLFLPLFVHTQTLINNISDYNNNTIDRLEIKGVLNPKIHTSIKEISIDDFKTNEIIQSDTGQISLILNNEYLDDIILNNYGLLKAYTDNYIIDKLNYKESKGFLKLFYKNQTSLFEINKDDLYLKVNPMINFSMGRDFDNRQLLFQNTRGVEINGMISNRLYFYSNLEETQRNFLKHINNRIDRDKAIPGQALYKSYSSSVFNDLKGYDFMNAKAYFEFRLIPKISVSLGHGNFFIGNGIRSLLLSDYGQNYYFMKFDTKVWKLHYQNIFAELSSVSHEEIGTDKIVPKKYLAAHYLNLKHKNVFEAGLYEAVIYHRNDRLELQYFNPVILYRTVEHFIGSPDNVLIGLNWKYNLLKRFSYYGQLMLDEFNFGIIKKDLTWWGNKYGFQSGLKYIDVGGIDHLDLQIEYNIVRPYTYSHSDSLSYSHYNQPLAHPLGSNFKEFTGILSYRPFSKLFLKMSYLNSIHGDDFDKYSYGGNILKSYNLRPLDAEGKMIEYGYKIGSGIKRNILQYKLECSYMFFHNYFLDIDIGYRSENTDNNSHDFNEMYVLGGLRINISKCDLDY